MFLVVGGTGVVGRQVVEPAVAPAVHKFLHYLTG